MAQTRMLSGAKFDGERLGQDVHRAFGGVVGRQARPRPQSRRRADIDDDAADLACGNAAPPPGRPRNTPFTLTAKILSNSSSSMSSIGLLTWVAPALLTRISSAPKADSVSSTSAASKSAFLRHVAAQRDGVVADGACGGFRRVGIDVGQARRARLPAHRFRRCICRCPIRRRSPARFCLRDA